MGLFQLQGYSFVELERDILSPMSIMFVVNQIKRQVDHETSMNITVIDFRNQSVSKWISVRIDTSTWIEIMVKFIEWLWSVSHFFDKFLFPIIEKWVYLEYSKWNDKNRFLLIGTQMHFIIYILSSSIHQRWTVTNRLTIKFYLSIFPWNIMKNRPVWTNDSTMKFSIWIHLSNIQTNRFSMQHAKSYAAFCFSSSPEATDE